MSRWKTTGFDTDIRGTARAVAILTLFDNYRLLPANWVYALLPDDVRGQYEGAKALLKRMTRAGLLARETLNGRRNNNETMTYSRTDCGTQEPCAGNRCGRHYLHKRGFEGLPHDGTHDVHQILVDLADAQIELGARVGTEIELLKWREIRDHPSTPELPKRPFRFDYGSTCLIPDGRPFALKAGHEAILFLKEVDRNTEEPATIKTKLKHYAALQDQIKKRYGFKSFMLLFITTNKTREQNILRWVKDVIGECKWVLTTTMVDHVRQMLSTAPVATHLFDVPWNRAHWSMFSLKELRSVSRPGVSFEGGKWVARSNSGFSVHDTEADAAYHVELNTRGTQASPPRLTLSDYEENSRRQNEEALAALHRRSTEKQHAAQAGQLPDGISRDSQGYWAAFKGIDGEGYLSGPHQTLEEAQLSLRLNTRKQPA